MKSDDKNLKKLWVENVKTKEVFEFSSRIEAIQKLGLGKSYFYQKLYAGVKTPYKGFMLYEDEAAFKNRHKADYNQGYLVLDVQTGETHHFKSVADVSKFTSLRRALIPTVLKDVRQPIVIGGYIIIEDQTGATFRELKEFEEEFYLWTRTVIVRTDLKTQKRDLFNNYRVASIRSGMRESVFNRRIRKDGEIYTEDGAYHYKLVLSDYVSWKTPIQRAQVGQRGARKSLLSAILISTGEEKVYPSVEVASVMLQLQPFEIYQNLRKEEKEKLPVRGYNFYRKGKFYCEVTRKDFEFYLVKDILSGEISRCQSFSSLEHQFGIVAPLADAAFKTYQQPIILGRYVIKRDIVDIPWRSLKPKRDELYLSISPIYLLTDYRTGEETVVNLTDGGRAVGVTRMLLRYHVQKNGYWENEHMRVEVLPFKREIE